MRSWRVCALGGGAEQGTLVLLTYGHRMAGRVFRGRICGAAVEQPRMAHADDDAYVATFKAGTARSTDTVDAQ